MRSSFIRTFGNAEKKGHAQFVYDARSCASIGARTSFVMFLKTANSPSFRAKGGSISG